MQSRASGFPSNTPLGHVVVGDLLGVGGMGEVYRAVDTRLLASLNHPNIASTCGLEEVESTRRKWVAFVSDFPSSIDGKLPDPELVFETPQRFECFEIAPTGERLLLRVFTEETEPLQLTKKPVFLATFCHRVERADYVSTIAD